ncbi:protein SRC2 homolog [Syzygium oleosum]|uniref:protein SRC2 homolog n=1 Tax=Syzygium oleosum TaxID=219896 RepID=UPI0024BA09DD|nr:protein SRC2 homolog [Syzygium oleosum]
MADTECRPLEVTVISARDLEDVRDHLPMHPYVVVSLCGDQRYKKKQRTPVHEDGGTSPRWDHALADPFTVDVAAASAGHLNLKLKIKTRRTVKNNKDVGWVDVPVGELLEEGDDGEPRATSYAVSLPSGGTRGFLEFSYKFGEAFTVRGAAPDQRSENQRQPRPDRFRDCFRGAIVGGSIWGAMSNADGDG